MYNQNIESDCLKISNINKFQKPKSVIQTYMTTIQKFLHLLPQWIDFTSGQIQIQLPVFSCTFKIKLKVCEFIVEVHNQREFTARQPIQI